jgi:hypothetical protein
MYTGKQRDARDIFCAFYCFVSDMENPIYQYFGPPSSESTDEYYDNLADSYLDEKDKSANVDSAETDDFLVKQILHNDFDSEDDEGREMFVYKENNGEFDHEETEHSRSPKSTGYVMI